MKKIVHFSSVHKRHDIRIFLKECVTLAEGGYDVTFVVADGLGDETKSGVQIIDAGKPASSRLGRMVQTTRAVYECGDASGHFCGLPHFIHFGLLGLCFWRMGFWRQTGVLSPDPAVQ